MVLSRPDFTVVRPSGLADAITDAEWWLWERLHELEQTSELGGILAWKRGFHSTGKYNEQNFPGDYSIRDAINRTGPWWYLKCSALDWTFPEAHGGNYARIQRYSARLDRSSRDADDPRLDLVLFEWYGQADFDTGVEGWNELRDEFASSDPSHLFHIHFSFLRNKCGDFWGMWALLTVLMGWSVAQWRASLEDDMAYNDTAKADAAFNGFETVTLDTDPAAGVQAGTFRVPITDKVKAAQQTANAALAAANEALGRDVEIDYRKLAIALVDVAAEQRTGT